jgi:hypothetical protein
MLGGSGENIVYKERMMHGEDNAGISSASVDVDF